ncbi:hypothetical protein [Nocardia sp. CC227C]|uniref:hypothetical protein n=1 Tax=Nocardia sp. CC227C TaxID=3044562 RepID=UPI00278C6B5E|nr:hypothetical protein [Nocardia sp. CC227C]
MDERGKFVHDGYAVPPKGYTPIRGWPHSMRLSAWYAVFGVVLVVVGVFAGRPLGTTLAAVGVMIVLAWMLPRRTTVEMGSNPPVLRAQRLRDPQLIAVLSTAGVGVAFLDTGLYEGGALFVVVGAVLVALTAYAIVQRLVVVRAYSMTFSPASLIITGGSLVHEFDWEDIEDVELIRRPWASREASLKFRCRTARSEVSRNGPIERSGAWGRQLRPSVWIINTVSWSVDPNGLLSTVRYFLDHPDRRTVSSGELAAMLESDEPEFELW